MPTFHDHTICGMTLLAHDIIAVAGGSSITFRSLTDLTKQCRVTFDSLPDPISWIGQDKHLLRCQMGVGSYFVLYPYSAEVYELLHPTRTTLSDDQLEVAFKVAYYKLREGEELDFEEEDDELYDTLPDSLRTLIDYFLKSKEEILDILDHGGSNDIRGYILVILERDIDTLK